MVFQGIETVVRPGSLEGGAGTVRPTKTPEQQHPWVPWPSLWGAVKNRAPAASSLLRQRPECRLDLGHTEAETLRGA